MDPSVPVFSMGAPLLKKRGTARVGVKKTGINMNVSRKRREKRAIELRKEKTDAFAARRKAAVSPSLPDTTSTADIIISLGEAVEGPLTDGVYYNTCLKKIHTYEAGRYLNVADPSTVDPVCLLKISRKNYPRLNKYLTQRSSGAAGVDLDTKPLESNPPTEHDWACVPTVLDEETGQEIEQGCPDYTTNFLYFMRSRKYATSGFNPTDEILAAQAVSPVIGGPEGITDGAKAIWQMLPTDKTDPLRKMYMVYAFVRNLIDFLHDFLNVGVGQYKGLIAAFKGKYPWAAAHPKFVKWVPRISDVITTGDNVNQNTCRSLCEELIVDFAQTVDIPWLVGNRANALVCTASLINDAELDTFFNTLVADGVQGLYIESMMGSAAPLYVKAASKGIGYVAIRSGDWDAGSGFSWEKAKKLAPTLSKIEINRSGLVGVVDPRTNVDYVPAPFIADSPTDTAWSSFGLNEIYLNEGTKDMFIQGLGGPFVLPGLAGKPQKLSVNSICLTVGLPKVRGKKVKGEDDEGRIAPLTIMLGPPTGPRAPGVPPTLDVMMPKAWTDTVQTLDSIADPIYHKVGIVYSDILAELTGMFEGNKCSILYNDGKLHYYCYDTRARNVPDAIIQRKLHSRAYVLANLQAITSRYILPWFDTTGRAVQYMIEHTIRPSIYLAAMRAIDMIAVQKTKLIENISKLLGCTFAADGSVASIDYAYNSVVVLPTTVDEFLNKITNSEEIIGEFDTIYETLETIAENIGEEVPIKLSEGVVVDPLRLTRLDPVKFIDLLYQLKQTTTDIMPKDTPVDIIYRIVGAVIAFGFSLQPYYATVAFANIAATSAISSKQHHLQESLKSALAKVPFTSGYTAEEQVEILQILRIVIAVFQQYIEDEEGIITVKKVLGLDLAGGGGGGGAGAGSNANMGGGARSRRTYRRKSRSKRTRRIRNRTVRR